MSGVKGMKWGERKPPVEKGPGRSGVLTLESKMELRRAFRDHRKLGSRMRFYQDQGNRLGVHYVTIRRAVLG